MEKYTYLLLEYGYKILDENDRELGAEEICDALEQLEAENAALKRYVFHKIECELSPKSPVKYSAKCTCGLHALLTAEESE